MRQTDSVAHKLKPRSFHKSAHLRVHSADFHPSVNHAWHVVLIQEPPWLVIHKIPSSLNSEGDDLVGTIHHPNWILFTHSSTNRLSPPRVLAYINIHLSSLRFSLRTNIINHLDILLISFINAHVSYFILNIYSDSSHSALKYLKCQDCWQWTLFLFSLFTLFYFSFTFSFLFLFLEQLRLGFISHAVTSVTSWWHSHKTGKNGVEGSGIKWCHTTWTTYISLISYTWSFRIGCIVVSIDHE